MVSNEIKSIQDDLQVEINTMRDAYTHEFVHYTDTQLRQRQSNNTKIPPKNPVRQLNIVPPDIMDIDTVTQLTTAMSILKTALLATTSKTRTKKVHFNAIVDVKEIEYIPKT